MAKNLDSGNKMMQFVNRDRYMPEKRDVAARNDDFCEIYHDFVQKAAADQSARCSQCGMPFCQIHCPLQNNIPDWLKLAAEGRWQEAYHISQETNSFPEICGRICPQDRLCEGSCVIEQSGHGAVTIGAIEKYITDLAWEKGWVKPITSGKKGKLTVGIIGSGPAGLAAADKLIRSGVKVTLYDRHDRAGGLLTYGIPGFKLEKEVVMRRIDQFQKAGAQFVLKCEIGKDLSFAELRKKHNALLIATGVYQPHALGLPELEGGASCEALDYLVASCRKIFADKVPEFDSGALNAAGKRVLVIGGGDTAMDCVRTAIRQGASEVCCLYRRDRKNMPGSQREVANAEEEGVLFQWMSAPKALLADGTVKAIKMQLGMSDEQGRSKPQEIPGSEFTIESNMVIKALGFRPENLPQLWSVEDLHLQPWGTVKAAYPSMETSLDGVFAAGDIVRGASLVVWAIREGRDAAEGILRYLARQQQKNKAA